MSLPCDNPCESSLIVRVDTPNSVSERYLKVHCQFPNHKYARKLIDRKQQWRFQVIRMKEPDESLDQYLEGENVYGQKIRFPIW
jgi:hypothetical protein